jgi:hypothetical protein
MNEEVKNRKKWWQTIPGAIGALTGLITAITGLIIALQEVGVFTTENESNNGVPSISSIISENVEPNDKFAQAMIISGVIISGVR